MLSSDSRQQSLMIKIQVAAPPFCTRNVATDVTKSLAIGFVGHQLMYLL